METVAVILAPGNHARIPWSRPGWRWAAGAGFLALACWAVRWVPLNNDVSWQYWVARQMRGGTVLYRDVVEVNPPLWFWEAIPISALAARLRIDAGHLAIVSVMARVLLALLLMAKLLDDRPSRRLGWLLAGLAVILCVLPMHDFGEREHVMLLGALPYAALAARRRAAHRAVSPWLAGGVGLFAAYGFAMKPYFALVPLALEAWLALGMGRSWRLLRPETIALLVTALLYAAAIALFAPDYVRLTVPLAMAAYGAFAPPYAMLFDQFWMPACLLSALALASAYRALTQDARAAAITATALAACYCVQGKGFSYQALPVAAALGWGLWLSVVESEDPLRATLRRPLATSALLLLAVTAGAAGFPRTADAGAATDAVKRLPPGSTVAVISAHSGLAFPLVEDRRFVWPMRTMGLWTIPAIANGAATTRGLSIRRQTLDMIAADLWCHPPDAILVDDPERSPALRGRHFSYEAFIRSDVRLRTLLAHYRSALSWQGATVYKRRTTVVPNGRTCRSITIRPDFA